MSGNKYKPDRLKICRRMRGKGKKRAEAGWPFIVRSARVCGKEPNGARGKNEMEVVGNIGRKESKMREGEENFVSLFQR